MPSQSCSSLVAMWSEFYTLSKRSNPKTASEFKIISDKHTLITSLYGTINVSDFFVESKTANLKCPWGGYNPDGSVRGGPPSTNPNPPSRPRPKPKPKRGKSPKPRNRK